MNCPNCAAALEHLPNRMHLRCEYCRTLHFPDAISEGVILLGTEQPINCPCCETALQDAILDGDKVGYCVDCRGVLLDSDHFAQVIAERREASHARFRRIEPIDADEFRRVTCCPQCDQRMDTHPYGAGGNAIIDSCACCRLVWLDAGELTVLETYPSPR